MCKTFNNVPLPLTYPSRINLTQTNNFTVKSVEGVFHSFDSLIACRCNDYLRNIRNSSCWQLNSTALTLYRLFKNYWTHRHRFGDSCTHSPPTDCASRHPVHHLVRHNFQHRRTVASGVDDRWQADLIDLPNPNMFNNGHTFCVDCRWKVFKLCMGWAAEELNRQVYSQSLCKNSRQRRAEDVVFVHGSWSRVRQQAFSTLP